MVGVGELHTCAPCRADDIGEEVSSHPHFVPDRRCAAQGEGARGILYADPLVAVSTAQFEERPAPRYGRVEDIIVELVLGELGQLLCMRGVQQHGDQCRKEGSA